MDTETFDQLQALTANGLTAASSKPIERLSALDALFDATGTVDIKVTRGGKQATITLPIQSVDNELADALGRNEKS